MRVEMNTVPLSSIFNIVYGSQLDLNKLVVDFDNGVNFISRSKENLGVQTKIKNIVNKTLFKKGSITVALGGSVLSSFVQKEDFYTGQNIKVLTPKQHLTDLQKKFYCMAIEFNAYKYSACGREANKTLNDLLVPALDCIPDWANKAKIKTPSKESITNKKFELNIENWSDFEVDSLFDITGSKSFTKIQIKLKGSGQYPYVVTSSKNNGVHGFYNYYTEEGGVLTIDSATVGSCFYQHLNFSSSDHVEKLIPKFNMNKYISLFLTTIFGLEKYRYGYGRKFSQTRIKKTKIKLPAKNNQPDWEFMENYIKSLPYSKSL
jgi:hypothetical protein